MPGELHNELTRRALIWLSNISTGKGIRACPEVTLSDGYVADGGAILNLQMSWDYRFFKGHYYSTLRIENSWPATDDFSFIIESKASRSDFNKTFINSKHLGDRMIPAANFHFIVAAKGVVPPGCYTSFWGILEESRNGLKMLKLPEYCPNPSVSLHEFAYRILRFSKRNKFLLMDLKEVHVDDNIQLTDG